MPEPAKPAAAEPAEPAPPAEPAKTDQEKEMDIGDFVTRHVLEKDSVFFEG